MPVVIREDYFSCQSSKIIDGFSRSGVGSELFSSGFLVSVDQRNLFYDCIDLKGFSAGQAFNIE